MHYISVTCFAKKIQVVYRVVVLADIYIYTCISTTADLRDRLRHPWRNYIIKVFKESFYISQKANNVDVLWNGLKKLSSHVFGKLLFDQIPYIAARNFAKGRIGILRVDSNIFEEEICHMYLLAQLIHQLQRGVGSIMLIFMYWNRVDVLQLLSDDFTNFPNVSRHLICIWTSSKVHQKSLEKWDSQLTFSEP